MRDRKAAQTSSDEIATDRPDVTNSRAAPTNRRWRPNLSFCRASKGRQSSSRCATSGYVGVNSASILARFVSVCGKPMRVYGAVCRTETSILNGSRVTGSSRFFPALKQRPRSPHESPVANRKDGQWRTAEAELSVREANAAQQILETGIRANGIEGRSQQDRRVKPCIVGLA